MAIVLLCKTWNHTRPVLSQTPFQVVSHTDVQCCVALVCKNIYVVLIIHDSFYLSSRPISIHRPSPLRKEHCMHIHQPKSGVAHYCIESGLYIYFIRLIVFFKHIFHLSKYRPFIIIIYVCIHSTTDK